MEDLRLSLELLVSMNLNNQLIHILRRWYEQKDAAQWVLGVIYDTQGSCYRKAGSMVFFNNLGEQFGLLSGGCLESDIKLNSRKVMDDLKPRCVTYDDSDEEDVSFKLGVGCGGTVHLILLPITKENHYLQLDKVLKILESGEICLWQQPITQNTSFTTKVLADNHNQDLKTQGFERSRSTLTTNSQGTLLTVRMTPPPHLLIVGGGLDAFYLCRLAAQTGWQTTLWDPRPAQGRKSDFPFVDNVLDGPAQKLAGFTESHKVDAVVLMSHSKSIDTAALAEIYPTPLKYIGMLGPKHRRDEVIEKAGISYCESNQFIAGPAGLDIGGDLPESIAISIMAQCHAAIHNKTARALSEPKNINQETHHD